MLFAMKNNRLFNKDRNTLLKYVAFAAVVFIIVFSLFRSQITGNRAADQSSFTCSFDFEKDPTDPSTTFTLKAWLVKSDGTRVRFANGQNAEEIFTFDATATNSGTFTFTNLPKDELSGLVRCHLSTSDNACPVSVSDAAFCTEATPTPTSPVCSCDGSDLDCTKAVNSLETAGQCGPGLTVINPTATGNACFDCTRIVVKSGGKVADTTYDCSGNPFEYTGPPPAPTGIRLHQALGNACRIYTVEAEFAKKITPGQPTPTGTQICDTCTFKIGCPLCIQPTTLPLPQSPVGQGTPTPTPEPSCNDTCDFDFVNHPENACFQSGDAVSIRVKNDGYHCINFDDDFNGSKRCDREGDYTKNQIIQPPFTYNDAGVYDVSVTCNYNSDPVVQKGERTCRKRISVSCPQDKPTGAPSATPTPTATPSATPTATPTPTGKPTLTPTATPTPYIAKKCILRKTGYITEEGTEYYISGIGTFIIFPSLPNTLFELYDPQNPGSQIETLNKLRQKAVEYFNYHIATYLLANQAELETIRQNDSAYSAWFDDKSPVLTPCFKCSYRSAVFNAIKQAIATNTLQTLAQGPNPLPDPKFTPIYVNRLFTFESAPHFGGNTIEGPCRHITGMSPVVFVYAKPGSSVVVAPSAVNVTYADPKLPWSAQVLQNNALLLQGVTRDRLYYEYNHATFEKPENGWIIKTSDLSAFVTNQLARHYNLTQKETDSVLQELRGALATKPASKALFIGQITEQNVLEKLPLFVQPASATIYRVHLYVAPAAQETSVFPPPKKPIVNRDKNTTVVELGVYSP